ncbi:RNA polymerase sigma factor [Aquimarina sp. 2201CG14-23]|uniref:RNA polymerase sigma factor n=1 Tax=Aquimarina mycalae TaxID=3040073 RepID=UPI002477F5FF|nr:RNA polymerase sigma factor [Aquimarina sp. 2201CG14-23]MDH7445560.1 RNA polymerase sigma factor [Aquimarina sp. 2201CG14-23]
MNEKEFIKSLQEGQQKAFSELLKDYEQKVFGTCISFVPNKEDAEDLTQEVFVEIYNSIGKFNGKSKLSTWIYRISVNKSLEFIRKKNTKKRFAILQSLFTNESPIDNTLRYTEFNHPGILMENKEKAEILFNAINKLPKDQRIVFTLSKIDGQSYKEICEITNRSLSSVESLLFRSKKNLQKLLYDFYKNQK